MKDGLLTHLTRVQGLTAIYSMIAGGIGVGDLRLVNNLIGLCESAIDRNPEGMESLRIGLIEGDTADLIEVGTALLKAAAGGSER